ncbi:hypothetical protein IQ250_23755 [Pseudanabaenaceae cyanobacterium LEGE 13415]|nr:hypothetical protein [Pseudanabaenaceae cyanobacterium LEGE 13415]
MDLSSLKWLKNVKPHQGWAYCCINEMPIPEARIFRLHWRSNTDKSIHVPQKGDLMVLVQSAKATHIVELLDNVVYGNSEEEWSSYRIVKAIWMPPTGFDWSNLPHQKEAFGVDYLPPDGYVHNLSRTDQMFQFNQYWQPLGGLESFQNHLKKVLSSIS